jgi:hypothetical protein
MRWIAQVGHVAAKDVRYARWLLMAYFAIVIVTAVGFVSGPALGPYWMSPNTEVLGMRDSLVVYLPLCTVILGLIVAASLVQADSPTRATAFWASRPLSPVAVLASKIVFMFVVLIALPLLVGVAALRPFDASGRAMTGMVAHAAVSYGAWLVAAMVIGSLTDDIRTFVGVFVATLAAMLVVLATLQEVIPASVGLGAGSAAAVLAGLKLIGLAGGVSLLALLYREHGRRRRAWIAGIAATVCLVFASVAEPSSGLGAPPTPAVGPPLQIELIDPKMSGQPDKWQLLVRIARGSDSVRFNFRPDSARFENREGISVADGNLMPVALGDEVLPPLGQPVRWIIDPPSPEYRGIVTYAPRKTERQILSQGVKSITLDGMVTVFRPHVFATLPLRDGAVVTRDGRRLWLYGVFSRQHPRGNLGSRRYRAGRIRRARIGLAAPGPTAIRHRQLRAL